MQLPLERVRQIAVMAQRLDADRPAGMAAPRAGGGRAGRARGLSTVAAPIAAECVRKV